MTLDRCYYPAGLHLRDDGRTPIPRDAGTLPIGLTVELEERADAARGAWRVFKTALGDEVLELARDGCRSGCQSVSWKSLGVTAGTRTAAA